MRRLRGLAKQFDSAILQDNRAQESVNRAAVNRRAFDFRGKRRESSTGAAPLYDAPKDAPYCDEDKPRMLPRKARLQSFFYLCLFGLWNAGVILFIMNRVGGRDLDKLEEEAHQKLRVARLAKEGGES
mgnify:CR=1 FL=1